MQSFKSFPLLLQIHTQVQPTVHFVRVFVCRSGVIKSEMFEELKERLEAAADAAHEEYCDAVKVTIYTVYSSTYGDH